MFLSNAQGEFKMFKRNRKLMFNWFSSFMILLLIGLLLPTGSALAQAPTPPLDPFAKHLPANGTKVQIPILAENITPHSANNYLQDPSFEAGGSGWGQYSTNFGTPLCTTAICGDGAGTAGPHTGSVWGWFGGTTANEIADLYQNLNFPACNVATLQFYFWIGKANAGSNTGDFFIAAVDGNVVFTANATQKSSYSTYKLISINVSPYANGAVHQVEFYSNTSGQIVTFNLDDVSLVGCPTISGNAGVAGATMNYTGGSTLTDGGGNYSFDVLPGWAGTVTPSKAGYIFSPVNRP